MGLLEEGWTGAELKVAVVVLEESGAMIVPSLSM
jgi:hypothetical protein